MSGHEVGVQMRFEDVTNLEVLVGGRLYIQINVALRINYSRLATRTDHVGGMSQTAKVELFEIHSPTPSPAGWPT